MYIIPEPQEWELHEGKYEISYDSRILIDNSCSDETRKYALTLQKAVLSETGLDLMVTKGASEKAAITMKKKDGLAKEEYVIEVCGNGIFIMAGANAGMLYGVRTLVQIMKQAGARVPYMNIHDYPDIAARGLYYDVTRSRIPTLDYLKKIIDRISHYKLNQFQLYIEHSYLFENLSEVWRDDTPLTSQEIIELDEYCRERNIELVPSIASFGHLYKVLRTKSYAHLCEKPELCEDDFGFVDRMEHHTLDVSNPQSMQFVKQLITEYMSLFTSDKFNICGDETFDLGKGRSKELADKIGIQNMYIGFVKELCEFLVEKGKTPMFWGDIICKFPEAIQKLPKETICMNWGYDENQDDESVRKLAEAGAVRYCCPGVRGWDQFVNQIEESYENIRRMCTYAIQYHAAGVLNTDWGDCGHVNHPDFGITGMIYGAAFSWNKNIPEFDEINRQISRLEFEDSSEQFVGVISGISKNWIYKWRNAVNFKENREEAFTEEQLKDVNAVIGRLNQIKSEIMELMPNLDSRRRNCVYSYLIAIDGMILLQRLGKAVSEIKGNHQEHKRQEHWNLAADLEKWFYYYKKEWRTVSRESELYQVQDVVLWYADFLRA